MGEEWCTFIFKRAIRINQQECKSYQGIFFEVEGFKI